MKSPLRIIHTFTLSIILCIIYDAMRSFISIAYGKAFMDIQTFILNLK